LLFSAEFIFSIRPRFLRKLFQIDRDCRFWAGSALSYTAQHSFFVDFQKEFGFVNADVDTKTPGYFSSFASTRRAVYKHFSSLAGPCPMIWRYKKIEERSL